MERKHAGKKNICLAVQIMDDLIANSFGQDQPAQSAQVDLSRYSFYDALTHYHTIPHFDALQIYSCGKHCEKRRNCL